MTLLVLTIIWLTSQVLPTIADNLVEIATRDGETQTATIERKVDTFETETVSQEPQTQGIEPIDSSSDSETVAEEQPPPPPPPPRSIQSQLMEIKFPTTLRVDPRANSVFLPKVIFESQHVILVCLSSSNLNFDWGDYALVNDLDGSELLVSGDMSSNFRISGPASLVQGILNSNLGLKLYGFSLAAPNSSALLRIVNLDRASITESLCAESDNSNLRTLQIERLGISQTITKAKVGLGKKK